MKGLVGLSVMGEKFFSKQICFLNSVKKQISRKVYRSMSDDWMSKVSFKLKKLSAHSESHFVKHLMKPANPLHFTGSFPQAVRVDYWFHLYDFKIQCNSLSDYIIMALFL